MSKLPQKIEEKFDREFKYFSGHEMLQTHQGHDIVKSFIATILDEERERITKMIRDEVIKYVQEAIKNPKGDNYIYAENIPLSRLDKIINIIKEDEHN